MPRSSELQKQAVEKLDQARSIYDKYEKKAKDEKRDITAEEQAEYRKILDEHEVLRKSAEQAKDDESKFEAGEKWASSSNGRSSGPGDSQAASTDRSNRPSPENASLKHKRSVAFRGWCKTLCGADPSEEEASAARETGLNLRSSELKFGLHNNAMEFRGEYRKALAEGREVRALSSLIPTAGAYTNAEDFVTSLETAMLTFGGIRNAATIRRTATGTDLPFPTSNDTSNTGARIQENVAAGEQDKTYGAVVLHAYEYTSKIIRIPRALIEDSAINIEQDVGNACGERLGRIEAQDCTTGGGGADPMGIVTAASLGYTAASQTAFTADEMMRLKYSVAEPYRKMPGAGYMMHDNSVLHMKLLKDGVGRYLWQEGLLAGEPARFDGYPVYISMEMASSLTASSKPVLFGALSKFIIREVRDITLRRTDQRYWEYDQVAFEARMRFDSNLLDAGVAPVKYLQMAS